MKKTLGLVMVLVMILTAISAFAAVPSKTTADLVIVTCLNKNVTATATDNDSEAVVELLAALMADNSIPEEAKGVLPEGSTYTKVEEVVTIIITGGTAEEDLIINLKFPTSFAGKDVAVLLGALPDTGLIPEWQFVEGTGKDDGSVDVVLNGELQDWLNGREFIALVID